MKRALKVLVLPCLLLSSAAFAADTEPPSCKESLEAYHGKPAADMIAAWGEPTSRAPWKRGGSRLVWNLDTGDPRTETEVGIAIRPSGEPGTPVGGYETSVTRSYEKGEGGKGRSVGPAVPEPWVPFSYTVWVDAAGIVKKTDCKTAPPGSRP